MNMKKCLVLALLITLIGGNVASLDAWWRRGYGWRGYGWRRPYGYGWRRPYRGYYYDDYPYDARDLGVGLGVAAGATLVGAAAGASDRRYSRREARENRRLREENKRLRERRSNTNTQSKNENRRSREADEMDTDSDED